MYKTLIAVTVLTLALALAVFAQDNSGGGSATTMKGYIVDEMCGKDMAGKSDAMTKASKHPASCALKSSCSESGYGLVSDGKWYKFDDNGNTEAKALLEKSKNKKGGTKMVEVTGTRDGDNLAVTSIKEVKSGKSGKKMKTKTS